MNTNGRGLEGRIIVVTGASSGVGYAAARRLALQEGAVVVAVGRRRMFRIEALSKQIAAQSLGESMLPVTADMAAPGQAQALAAQVLAQYGRIDGFVHAVNRALRLTALEVSDQEFDLTMMVNVKSALYGVQAIAPLMRQQGHGGVVIYNPTPTPTTTFAASEAVYAAAANALSGLASGWGRQLEACGIRVREVAPMPLGDQAPGDVCAHDELVLDALRETLAPALPTPHLTVAGPARMRLDDAAHRPLRDDPFLRPVVLSARGGLSLTQFSEQ